MYEAKDRRTPWGDWSVRPFNSGRSEGRPSVGAPIGKPILGGANPCPVVRPTPSRGARATTPRVGGTTSFTSRLFATFIKADASMKLTLVQDIVKSWELANPKASDPPKISEEEMAMTEVFVKEVKAVADYRQLEGLVSRYQRCCEKL